MSEFAEVTKRNADKFLKAFVERQDEALERWFAALETTGGPARSQLDYSPESTVPLWTWIRPRMKLADKADADIAHAPMWFEPLVLRSKHGGIAFTTDTLWWMDGFIYYWSEVLWRKFSGLYWKIDTDAKSFFYPHPKLSRATGMVEVPVFKMTRLASAAARQDPAGHDRRWLEIFDAIEEDQNRKTERAVPRKS